MFNPEFSQVGTIIQGPSEYYSSRLPNKDRKRSLVDEILSAEAANGRLRKKYSSLQLANANSKKGSSNHLFKKRLRKFKQR